MVAASLSEQPICSHSIKIEDTAKGIRLSVHVYANDSATAIEEAFNTYLEVKISAIDNKIPLAPVDSK